MRLQWLLGIANVAKASLPEVAGIEEDQRSFDVQLLQTEVSVASNRPDESEPAFVVGVEVNAGTQSRLGRSHTTVTVIDYPEEPVLDFELGSSSWPFSYNPAYVPGSPGVQEGLLVRVQNYSHARRGLCAMNKPYKKSLMAYTSIDANDPSKVSRLGGKEAVVFQPRGFAHDELTVEDPRVVLHDGLYYMTYTAHKIGGMPMNRIQGIATTETPHDASSWQRMCSPTKPCVKEDGMKSGAMLPRSVPPHYMLVYDLRDDKWDITMAESADLIHWNLTDQTLIDRRSGSWDEGLVEPGPPPLLLSNGNYLALYNSARFHNDREYHVGFVILDGEDPTKVLQRSEEPVLSFSDRPWMRGEGQDYLCNVPDVVFLAAARPLGADRFQLYFGAADATIGTAVIGVEFGSARKI